MPSLECNVPDPERLGLVEELVDLLPPYGAGDDEDDLFLGAMRQVVAWHVEHCPWYEEFLDIHRFSPEDLQTLNDCVALPSIPSRFFRTQEVLSIPREDVHVEIQVSDAPVSLSERLPRPLPPPPGLPQQILLDEWSVACAHRMLQGIFDYHGWLDSEEPVHYLVLGREPVAGGLFSDTLMEHFVCGLVPASSATYVLRHLADGRHEPDVIGAVDRLHQFCHAGEPVRIVGMRSLLARVLEVMGDMHATGLTLADGSLILLGAGSPEAPLSASRRGALDLLANRALGLSAMRMRDCISVLEQGVPLVECEFHRHHVPTWARAFVRHPRTLEPVAPGECGLLTVLSPVVTAAPSMSLLTEDLAVVHLAEDCECERQTDWVEFVGRVSHIPRLEPVPALVVPRWEGGET